ncbi:DUF441 domain-containing protein [Pelistega sp. NLN82]|uniref:UPF0756 membrane protein F9B74_01430 n=1 Tax=Pelistega ratti TaxID=2652177 RepID=A0A6L9Y3K5_9BURK|nr:DUF441 domain-containing protein [Pelistega ratti]NEN74992.1 DUF441 domain-containing protein [Pelistega ratti]
MFNFHFDTVAGLLVVLIILGVISHNSAITISACILLIMQQTALAAALPWVTRHGLHIGIIILTIGVLSPLVSGKILLPELKELLTNWELLTAIAVGVFVAWLGGKGVSLMTLQPTLVAGLMIGTVIGVAFFKGIPVGPLIAAGILALCLDIIR